MRETDRLKYRQREKARERETPTQTDIFPERRSDHHPTTLALIKRMRETQREREREREG